MTDCVKNDDKYKNMITFNSKFIPTSDNLMKQTFKALDMDGDGFMNIYDYITLRSFNNAYDILLVKENAVYYQNFPVAIHIIAKDV
jgi:hypothetical protein